MKICLFLLFAFAFQLMATNTNAQDAIIELRSNSVTVSQLISEIEKQTDYLVVYSNREVNTSRTVSLKKKLDKVSEYLNKTFQGTDIGYEFENNYIVLSRKAQETSSILTGLVQNAQQQGKTVKGVVTDTKGEPIIGATIVLKGDATRGTVTDIDGNYIILNLPEDAALEISYIGMQTQSILTEGRTIINITLTEDVGLLEEVVVVGYGSQKKETLVGSIARTSSDQLERRGISSSLSSALSAQVPGVTVMETTGEPGVNDPQILIRGRSTWNDSQPLIMVDGVERKMIDIDVSEVESISVLKDASATAVFGVKGANGVILITTKRGEVGKASFNITTDYGIKNISKIFTVMDSYDAIMWKNQGIENELSTNESSWAYYMPYEQLQRYKKPQQYPYNYLYPNVDWADEMTKDFATSYRLNLNVNGGTNFAKYFGSLSYLHEGDILASEYNETKGYDPGYAYDRFNFRGNVDLSLTKTTDLAVNLSGYMATKKDTNANSNRWMYQAMYSLAPDAFPVRHEDGVYGKHPQDINLHNPIAILNETGIRRETRSQINSDVKLKQDLKFITEGLSVSANISYDLYFGSTGPSITDGGNQGQTLYKYISPAILDATSPEEELSAIQWFTSVGSLGINEFDWVAQPWTNTTEQISNSSLVRSLFYQVLLNYARTFDDHDVSGLFLFNRKEDASGAEFKHYREDWVGRATYAYQGKYLAEVNGAYNGSEKFSSKYRFGFFPSLALGWMASNEAFMSKYTWLDKLKFRGSIGKVGSDAGIPRWAYQESWVRKGKDTRFTNTEGRYNLMSPYYQYMEDIIANPDLQWETSLKRNIGAEISVLRSLLSLEIDVFKDSRTNIFMSGSRRKIPALFGASPVAANIGETETQGYEIVLDFRKPINENLSTWAKLSVTNATDVVLKAEDPILLSDYQKEVGYAIGQTKTIPRTDFMNNWDDVYASSPIENNKYKLPGDWDLIDYNSDGIINTYDNIPYGFPNRPQKTYSASLGVDYKNFSFMMQFYGQKNILTNVGLSTPGAQFALVSKDLADYWMPENTDAYYKAPRVLTSSSVGDLWQFDGSFLRLKSVDLSYSIPKNLARKLGLSAAKVYVQGNNLLFWSKLPYDSEGGTSFNVANAYPMFRKINFGVNFGF